MSIHISRFIDSVKACESRAQRDFVMPLRDAKDLHADISKLLLTVTELQRRLLDATNSQVVNVELSGRDF